MYRFRLHIAIGSALLLLGLLSTSCKKDDPIDDPAPGKEEGGGGSVKDESFQLKVATVNLLKPSGRCSEMSLDNQKVMDALALSVVDTGADFIGFNEVDENYIPGGKYSIQANCTNLKDMVWKMEWPNKIRLLQPLSYSYANGFAYNAKKLKLEESGFVWLSKEEGIWYTSSYSAYANAGNPERTCLWARFTHIDTGRGLYFFVTHLPTSSQGGNLNMAGLVNDFAYSKASSTPSVLLGDMNYGPGTDEHKKLTSYWHDYNNNNWGTMSGSSEKYYYTAEVFTKNHPERRYDHILTRGCKASAFKLVVESYSMNGQNWCPSDHLPVTATVTF